MKKIIVYGHSDTRQKKGFPTEEDFIKFIEKNIFLEPNNGRYHYSQKKDADIIVLSRDGKAYGYFKISYMENPTENDIKVYDRCRKTYIVSESVSFEKPVQLSELNIKGYQFGKPISEQDFNDVKDRAGKKSIYKRSSS